VKSAGNHIIENQYHDILNQIPTNGVTRIGKDLFFGISNPDAPIDKIKQLTDYFFPEYRSHIVTTGGHIDGCFAPIKPGLIVSIEDMPTYSQTFPGWEVVYLKGESWSKVQPFLDLKKKNQGRWWIKGSEYDQELIDYVETWLQDWVGYAEESVFDVNILVIDQQNVIVNGYNKQAFEAFSRHGVTPHICPIRHRYFWDGGIHCVTLDLDRKGIQQDWFPERTL
jgi:N-dimethylarginine dimethylaminohydrolase